MMWIDAHCHIWALSRGDYDWLDQSDPALGPIAQDFGPSDLRERMDRTGIGRAVVVQAAPTEAETHWLLAQAAGAPHLAGVVGWVDLTQADLAQRLSDLSANPALRGIRPMLQDLAPDWLATAPAPGWADALIATGLRLDALVRPAHLETLAQVMASHPDLPVVIDHAAKPALAAPPDDPRHAMWRAGMARLAGETSACCKVSGLLTEMGAADLPHAREVVLPLLDQLLEWFGPERLMWGSDWPVLRLAGNYADWQALCAEWLASKPEETRTRISGANAARFYGLDDVLAGGMS